MVVFPGLSNLEIKINPVIVQITDNFALNWYGLIIAAGFLCAAIYSIRKCRGFGLEQDSFIDMLFVAVPSAVICARLLYVLSYWSDYADHPENILKTWMGGMSIYGGIIGAIIACSLFCWLRHVHVGAMLDVGAYGLLIGQAIGRWGNFVNGEVYGTQTTLPWRMTIYNQNGTLRAFEVHPLFLYECLWNVLGFFLLRIFAKKRRYNGQIFTMYLVWYGIGRALLEGLRDEQFNMLLGGNLLSRLIALICVVIGLVLLFYHSVIKKHEPEQLLLWQEDFYEHKAFLAAQKAARKKSKGKDTDGETEKDGEDTKADAPKENDEIKEDNGPDDN